MLHEVLALFVRPERGGSTRVKSHNCGHFQWKRSVYGNVSVLRAGHVMKWVPVSTFHGLLVVRRFSGWWLADAERSKNRFKCSRAYNGCQVEGEFALHDGRCGCTIGL